MKKVILAASMFVCLAAVANAQAPSTVPGTVTTPAVQENKNQADFKFEEEEYNFGTIKQGDKVTHDFNFVNAGKEPLVITEAHGSCGCTVPSWPKEPVAKGAKGVIHVEFNSTGKMGMQDKTVTITSNAKVGSKVLHLKGNVETPPPAPATPAGSDKK
jgi:hypothetical protein